jgi:rhombotail lipoprotein
MTGLVIALCPIHNPLSKGVPSMASLSRTVHVASAAAALSLAALAGCESSGLSPREAGARTVSSSLHALYDVPLPAGEHRPARLTLPTSVAVVQVGETAPPTSFLNALRARPDLFTRVEGLSGASGIAAFRHYPNDSTVTAQSEARRDVERLQQIARDMGMNHLLLVGGTIDQVTKDNNLAVLDLTIIGAFVLPSKQVEAEARASGALVDLESGRVALVASAGTSKSRGASTATQSAGKIDVLRDARDEVLEKLAADVIKQCQSRQQQGGAQARLVQ